MPKRMSVTTDDEEESVVNIFFSFCAQNWAIFVDVAIKWQAVPCQYNGLTGMQVTAVAVAGAPVAPCGGRIAFPYLYYSTASYNSPISLFAGKM